jgi:hypothetical protein
LARKKRSGRKGNGRRKYMLRKEYLKINKDDSVCTKEFVKKSGGNQSKGEEKTTKKYSVKGQSKDHGDTKQRRTFKKFRVTVRLGDLVEGWGEGRGR